MFAESEINLAIECALNPRTPTIKIPVEEPKKIETYQLNKIIGTIATGDFWVIFFDHEVEMDITINKIKKKLNEREFKQTFFSELEGYGVLLLFIPKTLMTKIEFYKIIDMELTEDNFPYYHNKPINQDRLGIINKIVLAVKKDLKERSILT